MTANFSIGSNGVRIIVVIIMITTALILHHQGHGFATALVLAAFTLGVAADVAGRVIPKEAC